jgi:thiol-disulfide isomerase/thioredoxin
MFRIAMRTFVHLILIVSLAALAAVCLHAAPAADAAKPGEPTDPKARKTFAAAEEWERTGNKIAAFDAFRKANKQDGGHCVECMRRAIFAGITLGEYKDAQAVAAEWLATAAPADQATVHYLLGIALQRQALAAKKDALFSASSAEFKAAIEHDPGMAAPHYALGVSLANLHQDDAARAEFIAYVDSEKEGSSVSQRAARFAQRVDLARATMAPPFSAVAMDGQRISMDGLAGKVVLIDFWATWCGPCREALPHIQHVAAEFAGRPFVVMSVSLDKDEEAWKKFVAKHGMTWPQLRDGSFDGTLATRFGVHAIPATFTIDADGVLEDQHVGDASFDGKLKKLIAQAEERGGSKAGGTTGRSAMPAN